MTRCYVVGPRRGLTPARRVKIEEEVRRLMMRRGGKTHHQQQPDSDDEVKECLRLLKEGMMRPPTDEVPEKNDEKQQQHEVKKEEVDVEDEDGAVEIEEDSPARRLDDGESSWEEESGRDVMVGDEKDRFDKTDDSRTGGRFRGGSATTGMSVMSGFGGWSGVSTNLRLLAES